MGLICKLKFLLMNKSFSLFLLFVVLIFSGCGQSNINPSESKETNDSSVVSFSKEGFSIKVPNSWKDCQEPSLIFCRILNDSDSLIFNPNVVITAKNSLEKLSLVEASELLLGEMDKSDYYNNYKIVNIENGTLNGISVVIMDFKFFTNDVSLGQTTALFDIENEIFNITFTAPNDSGDYVNYREIFIPVLYSIQRIN